MLRWQLCCWTRRRTRTIKSQQVRRLSTTPAFPSSSSSWRSSASPQTCSSSCRRELHRQSCICRVWPTQTGSVPVQEIYRRWACSPSSTRKPSTICETWCPGVHSETSTRCGAPQPNPAPTQSWPWMHGTRS